MGKPRKSPLVLITAIALCLAFSVVPAYAEIAKIEKTWVAVGTNRTDWVQTSAGNEAQVTFQPNGVQDGTINLYVCPAQTAATCTKVGTVAALSSTVTTFTGTSSAFLYLELTGNTPATGSIDAYVILKK